MSEFSNNNNIDNHGKKINPKLLASLKSLDTEEKIDIILFRPLGLKVAEFSKKFGIKPNTITIISIFAGVIAGHLFYYNNILINIIGILFLMAGSTLDSADGQLARMTNQCSRIGRILDGLSGYFWFVSIYIHLLLRFSPDYGSVLFYSLFAVSILSHSFQSIIADYYRNAHLHFVFGKNKSEFDSSETLKDNYKTTKVNMTFMQKLFALFYINYTRNQEAVTKNLQKFKANVKNIYNNILPEDIINSYRMMSRPLQKFCNGLTLNTRFYAIYAALIFNNIYIYLVYEAIILNCVLIYLILKHESNCKKLNNIILEKENK
jgi:phosphatidylglycerophosphate synthase